MGYEISTMNADFEYAVVATVETHRQAVAIANGLRRKNATCNPVVSEIAASPVQEIAVVAAASTPVALPNTAWYRRAGVLSQEAQ